MYRLIKDEVRVGNEVYRGKPPPPSSASPPPPLLSPSLPSAHVPTEKSASCGHGWNQSMTVQLTSAGNFRTLVLKASPTGEKARTTCRLRLKSVECKRRNSSKDTCKI